MDKTLDVGPRVSCEPDTVAGFGEGVVFCVDDTRGEIRSESDQGPAPADPFIGKKINRYTIKSLIGRGGMGAVYLAEQSVPVQRDVAIKILLANAGGACGTKRFIAERQALAMMNHTDIAQVYDAGQTDEGHHYFAMELVEGTPVDQFADSHKLSVHERLVLAYRVCDAIEHAHERGVLHRDIKPGNVIVSKMGKQTRLKIIDFGIAKGLGTTSIAGDAAETKVGQVIGTPTYMSPEQAELRNEEIDQRTDVYSIGVLIYKLLTGTTPLQPETLQGKTLTEVLQSIATVDAERPSNRMRNLDSASRWQLMQKLSTDATLHQQLLRSELDWLVLKAIHVDRNSRYASAAELGEDIRRYLDHEPIKAVSSSYGYYARKFYRRHRSHCIATMFVLIATLALVVTFAQFKRKEHVARAAVRNELDVIVAKYEGLRTAEPDSVAESADGFCRVLPGTHSGFLQILDPSNGTVDHGTYVGASLVDEILGLDLTADGWIAVGRSSSAGFPVTRDVVDDGFNGLQDGFVTRWTVEAPDSATIESVGRGDDGCEILFPTGVPTLGHGTFTLVLDGGPARASTLCALVVQDQTAGTYGPESLGTPVDAPISLAIDATAPYLILPFVADAAGQVQLVFPVPLDAQLIGLRLSTQGVFFDAFGAHGVSVSRGARIVIGTSGT